MKRGVRSQEVTDAQGRRRFHGAFTGGFSAGYYNSVGSEEGWTPRTFSSSRGNRSSHIEQRPEDFMDEEDDPLLGKRLETTERYDTLQTAAKRRLQQPDQAQAAAIPGFKLPEDWVLPINDSIGATLLKQMGWKEGHGIGQRIRRRKFIQEEKGEVENVEQGTEPDEDVYIPPRNVFDVQKAFPKPKLDRYGAGFDPYTDAPEFSIYKQQQEKKQKEKEGSHRQVVSFLDALKTTNGSNRVTSGYGLSALEENDDIDVYGAVSMTEFDRVIAPLGARKDVKRLDSSAQESRRHEKASRSRALCSDGRPVLPGFELATSMDKTPKAVNLQLAVPSEFKPYHHFDEDADQCDAVTALYRKFNFFADNATSEAVVTAKQRGDLLGDKSLCTEGNGDNVATAAGEDKNACGSSVFDLLGEKQRTKLFDAVAQVKQGLPLTRQVNSTTIEEPATPKTRQPLVRGSDGDQFRATISASIAKRFVPSTTMDEGNNESAQKKEPQVKVSHRSQSLWIPKSLLCKRFHVKCAGPTGSNGKNDENDKKRDLFDEELVPHLVEFAADRAAHRQTEDNTRVNSNFKAVEIKPAGDTELPPLPAVEKASTSLLKSIFEPSDESEVSEDDSDGESDVDDNNEGHNGVRDEDKVQRQLPSLLLERKSESAGRLQVSSEDSSSSDEDVDNFNVTGSGNDDGARSRKRSRSVDNSFSRDAKRQAKEERQKHKKHKKHKHRSSRDEDKKRKKDKKDRKERKSHKRRSSRRSRSRSAERGSSRRRSSSRRH